MDLPVDTVLADRYRIIGRRGRGGMAVVYTAHDEVLDRTVAVKVLADHLLDDPRALHRFEREARAAARLNHPNVVAVHDAAADGDIHFLVMELVDGTSLAERLHNGPLAVTETLAIADQVTAALAAAHAADLVHRDIKPSNILLTADGRAKVADFGIARAMTPSATRTATAMGSVPYIAPEQLDGRDGADPRSDLYAFGCVLFECVTGHAPFEGDSTAAVLGQHLHLPAPALDSSRRELDDLVADLLAKDPAARPQSATAVRERIASMGGGQQGADSDAHANSSVPLAPTERIDHYEYPPTEVLDDGPRTEVVDDRTHTKVLPTGFGADGPSQGSDEVSDPGGSRDPASSSVGRRVAIAVVLVGLVAVSIWALTALTQRPDPAATPTPTAPGSTVEPTATEPAQTQPAEAPNTATEQSVPATSTATPPASTPTTAPTPTGQPTTPRPTLSTSQQAIVDLRQTIEQGRDTGQLDARAADKISEAVTKVAERLADDDKDRSDKVREEIDKVREEIDKQVDDGGAVPGIAVRLNRDLDELADDLSRSG